MPSRARKVFAGEGVQILQGKTDGAFAFQRDAGQRQAHSLGDHGGYGGTCHAHLREAEEAVDQNGVAYHIQKVHGDGEHHHLFQQGVAPQNGAELDIQPLKQYRTAYDAGVKAGTVKGVLRRPQELKDQFRL